MKALTVAQPWAWALIHGTKRIENRKVATKHRGHLLIHAGKSLKYWVDELPDGTKSPDRPNLDFGALIGIVELIDCVPYEQVKDDPWAEPGGWCWIVANPRAVEAVTYRGLIGIFDVPEEMIRICVGRKVFAADSLVSD